MKAFSLRLLLVYLLVIALEASLAGTQLHERYRGTPPPAAHGSHQSAVPSSSQQHPTQDNAVLRSHTRPLFNIFKADGKLVIQRPSDGEILELYHEAAAGTRGGDGSPPPPILRINRYLHGANSSVDPTKGLDFSALTSVAIDAEGIFGIYRLPMGTYMAVIVHSEQATAFRPGVPGTSSGSIREIKELKLVAIADQSTSRASESSTDQALLLRAKQLEAERLLMDAFNRHNFYFSRDFAYDVTRSVQGNALVAQQYSTSLKQRGYESAAASWKGSDERFFWNLNVLGDLIDSEHCLDGWIVPVTNAWVIQDQMQINGYNLTLSVISRRSRRRQGPR
jgi:SacI homology domain